MARWARPLLICPVSRRPTRLPEGNRSAELGRIRPLQGHDYRDTPEPVARPDSAELRPVRLREPVAGTNTRLRWTFRAVGDLFVIYSHNVRDCADRWPLESNQLVIKLPYAFRRSPWPSCVVPFENLCTVVYVPWLQAPFRDLQPGRDRLAIVVSVDNNVRCTRDSKVGSADRRATGHLFPRRPVHLYR
jgi:hypothetical protein